MIWPTKTEDVTKRSLAIELEQLDGVINLCLIKGRKVPYKAGETETIFFGHSICVQHQVLDSI